MTYTRVSPGKYRGPDGRIVDAQNSQQAQQRYGGGSSTTQTPQQSTSQTSAAPTYNGVMNNNYMNPAQQQSAASNLDWQVQQGWITQQQADAQKGINAQGQQYNPNFQLNNAGDVFNAGAQINQNQTIQGNVLTNPNQYGPFASQQVTYDPVTGQPTVNTSLSQGNQNVVTGVQQGSVNANNVLNGVLNSGVFGNITGNAQGTPASNAFTDAVFAQLTDGIEDRKKREREQLEQTLVNRGIPLGSKLYNQQIEEFNKQYENAYANAKNQAVTQGNNYALQSIGTLSGIGKQGYFDQNLQPFQATPYQGVDVNSVFNTLQGTQLGREQIEADKYVASLKNRPGGGGGGGGGEDFSNPVISLGE